MRTGRRVMARREGQRRKSVFSLISWRQGTVRFRNPVMIISAVRDIAAGEMSPSRVTSMTLNVTFAATL